MFRDLFSYGNCDYNISKCSKLFKVNFSNAGNKIVGVKIRKCLSKGTKN